MSTDDSDRRLDKQEDIDEEELRRRYYERLSDWSEPDAVKINRGGKLVEPLAEFVQRMGAPYTVADIYVAGDRTDEHFGAFGRLAAQTFDELVNRDARPKYRHGRKPGEVPALLQAAGIASGLAPDKISLAHDPLEAADLAIIRGDTDSLVVLLEGSAVIWNYLTQRQPADVTV